MTAVGTQGNRISIRLSFSKGCNAAWLGLVNSGFGEESRLKDAVKHLEGIALAKSPIGNDSHHPVLS